MRRSRLNPYIPLEIKSPPLQPCMEVADVLVYMMTASSFNQSPNQSINREEELITLMWDVETDAPVYKLFNQEYLETLSTILLSSASKQDAKFVEPKNVKNVSHADCP